VLGRLGGGLQGLQHGKGNPLNSPSSSSFDRAREGARSVKRHSSTAEKQAARLGHFVFGRVHLAEYGPRAFGLGIVLDLFGMKSLILPLVVFGAFHPALVACFVGFFLKRLTHREF
jgi:hypothetical protein